MTTPSVDQVIDEALDAGAFPGGVLAIGSSRALLYLRAFGRLAYGEKFALAVPDTIYDLASLTKVVVTTPLAMLLVDAGVLHLDRPVAEMIPGFRGGDKEDVRVRHLLAHCSGMAWWAPLYREVKGRQAYLDRICAMPLEYEPGTRSVYSDLGFVLLGAAIEDLAGQTLDELARERVLEPLGMRQSGFRPPPEWRTRIAPTEDCPWRGRVVCGEVHDENACGLGGVAGHAGLFGTASDLARLAVLLLRGGRIDERALLRAETVTSFTSNAGVPGSTRALGWDTTATLDPSGQLIRVTDYSSAGTLMSARAFGHTGFTGTSLWIDPEHDLFVILLTNRVCPTRANDQIRAVRAALADAAVRQWGCGPISDAS